MLFHPLRLHLHNQWKTLQATSHASFSHLGHALQSLSLRAKQRKFTKQLHMYRKVMNINYKPLNKKFTWLLHMVKKLINFLFTWSEISNETCICWSIDIVGAHFPISFPTFFFPLLVEKLQLNCYQMSIKDKFNKLWLPTIYPCTISFLSFSSVKKTSHNS
jgi:hypothetical protein